MHGGIRKLLGVRRYVTSGSASDAIWKCLMAALKSSFCSAAWAASKCCKGLRTCNKGLIIHVICVCRVL